MPRGRGRGGKGNQSSQNKGQQTKDDPFSATSIGRITNIDIRESGPSHLPFFQSLETQFTNCEDTLSFFPQVIPGKLRGKHVTVDTNVTMVSWNCEPDTHIGKLCLRKGLDETEVVAYQKQIALIDPFRWMKYKERPSKPFFWNFQKSDILAPENQAYIDSIASFLVSKLRSTYNSPHFCRFFGTFRGVAKKFQFNLEEDLESIRFSRWFWDEIDAGSFKFKLTDIKTGRELTPDEIKTLLKPDDEFLHDDSEDEDEDGDDDDGENEDSTSSNDLDSNVTADELESIDDTKLDTPLELEEASLDDKSVSSQPIHLEKRKQTRVSLDASEASDVSALDKDYRAIAEFEDMPIVTMFTEACEGTMDDLLNMEEYAPIDTPEKEAIWSAWIFQVIVATCQLQGGLKLTHNDLHTNNILWKKTEQEFLWYKDSMGRVWKVPTYGRVFTIIDFGRAIFNINSYFCISSDYQDGHDAAGQYNFGPIEDYDYPKIGPNPSFDLCRLTCSLLRGLFPINPAPIENGKIITQETGLIVKETTNPLFNILWSWLKSDVGSNILDTNTGDEKYPGFDLYIAIAHTVHSAIPHDQLKSPVFGQFQVKKEKVPEGTLGSFIPL